MSPIIVALFSVSCNKSTDEPKPKEILTVVDFEENIESVPDNGAYIGKLDASSSLSEVTLTFSIIEENHPGAFDLDDQTGELYVKDGSLFNYETQQTVTAVVEVSGKSEKAIIDVIVTPVQEILTADNFNITIIENLMSKTLLGVISAETSHSSGYLSYSLKEESVVGSFDLDPVTGELFVNSEEAFDYETNPKLTAVVVVSGKSSSMEINVEVNLENSPEWEMIIGDEQFDLTNANIYLAPYNEPYFDFHYRRGIIITDGVFTGPYTGNPSNFAPYTYYIEIRVIMPLGINQGENVSFDLIAWNQEIPEGSYAIGLWGRKNELIEEVDQWFDSSAVDFDFSADISWDFSVSSSVFEITIQDGDTFDNESGVNVPFKMHAKFPYTLIQ